MVSWVGNGTTLGMERVSTDLLFSSDAYQLASPGTVDLNGVTRFQYEITDVTSFRAEAQFQYDAADVAEATQFGTTAPMGAVLFLAHEGSFAPGEIPTPSQIRLASMQIMMGRGVGGGSDTRTTAGNLDLIFEAPAEQGWFPNDKYWLLVAPVYFVAPEPVTVGTTVPLGNINVNGRAVSLWTNRTPDAPVITYPTLPVNAAPGSNVTFAFTTQDPDRFSSFPGDTNLKTYRDLAGVHIQYAPVPTAENPFPVWQTMEATDPLGVVRHGWYVVDSSGPDGGAYELWASQQTIIACGVEPLGAPSDRLFLPSGDWQIRLRTFDFGHALSTGSADDPGVAAQPPWMDFDGIASPEEAPAPNTSPWSEPVFISVSAQVPPPIPLSPINDTAAVDNESITFTWKYRNTYFPPFPQAVRTVQVRMVGMPDWSWYTLVESEASSSPSLEVDGLGFDFVSGNRYEWRVRVADTDGQASGWSEVARFWVVPPPGGSFPEPGDTIGNATLGCGTHRVEVYRRGGKTPVGEITDISSLEWNRVRDDISTAKIVVSGWGIDCGNLLADLQTWAYEIVIFRDNGYSVDRVWEGPITLLTYEHDSVTIHAKDVMVYLYRRIMKQAVNDFGASLTAGRSVVARAASIVQDAFAPDDPNVLSYLNILSQPDDAVQYRSTPAYSRTAFEEVDDMAANAGLDYTAVGRGIILWGTKHRIGTLPEFRDSDLGSTPIVSEYGMSMSNRYVVSDGNGLYGGADRLNEDDEDPTYGLVEMLSSTWASESPSDSGAYTEAGLATIRESFEKSSERSISDRYPPPVVVRVPDNTRLNPDVVLSIQHLVPGVVVPLRSTGTLRTVVATQKLDAVKVTETAGVESISITLSPFSRDDVEAEEGEA